jgi:hypothetical protein
LDARKQSSIVTIQSNSTLRYAMERIWKGQEATQK